MNNEDYIVIHGWMITELGLSGKKLLIYALIHGYSKDGKHEFCGSLEYIGKWIDSKRQHICTYLKELVEDGFLAKREENNNGIKTNYYHVLYDKNRCYENRNICSKKCNGGVPKIGNDNIIIKEEYISNNKLLSIYSKKKTTPKAKNISNDNSQSEQKLSFVKPSVDDVNAYIMLKDFHFSAERFVDYYESKGWIVGRSKMKNWKAACRNWERNWKEEHHLTDDNKSQEPDLFSSSDVNSTKKQWQS